MINRIKSFFRDPKGAGGGSSAHVAGRRKIDELHLAAAALLVEAACHDMHFDESERRTIESLVQARFGLSADEAVALIGAAERDVAGAVPVLQFHGGPKRPVRCRERVGRCGGRCDVGGS